MVVHSCRCGLELSSAGALRLGAVHGSAPVRWSIIFASFCVILYLRVFRVTPPPCYRIHKVVSRFARDFIVGTRHYQNLLSTKACCCQTGRRVCRHQTFCCCVQVFLPP